MADPLHHHHTHTHSSHPTHACLEAVDEGQEEVALKAALVERVGVAVGGGDEHKAAVPQRAKQAVQDHGVGDVGHKQLVQAQHERLRRGGGCVQGQKWN